MRDHVQSSVALRDVTDQDPPIFFAHMSDPIAAHMAAFMGRDPSDRNAFDAHWAKIRADRSVTIRTILFGGQVAGQVAIFGPPEQREVTYWIGREYWGKGIATRALSQFLRDLPARPLYACAAKDNLASLRVLEKCGFTVVGHSRFFAKARGEEVEEVMLRLDGDVPEPAT